MAHKGLQIIQSRLLEHDICALLMWWSFPINPTFSLYMVFTHCISISVEALTPKLNPSEAHKGPVIQKILHNYVKCPQKSEITCHSSLYLRRRCIVQHLHALPHCLYGCSVGEVVREKAPKVGVTEHQVKQMLCIQMQLSTKILQRGRQRVIKNKKKLLLACMAVLTGGMWKPAQ